MRGGLGKTLVIRVSGSEISIQRDSNRWISLGTVVYQRD